MSLRHVEQKLLPVIGSTVSPFCGAKQMVFCNLPVHCGYVGTVRNVATAVEMTLLE